MARRPNVLRFTLIAALIAAVLVATAPQPASAHQSFRHERCQQRADSYAAKPHEELTNAERQRRVDWLYSQCAQNDVADANAELQGSLAPELFPNRGADNHAHPLHCLDLSTDRFGMHTNEDTPNPPPNPTAPGGAAQLNIPGEFMYAWIDGAPRFLIREVVWAIDDIEGDVISPVRLNFQPAGLGPNHVTTAEVAFAEAYVPTSIWVELPTSLAAAKIMKNLPLNGRRVAARTWHRPSSCHDKRAPLVIPDLLVDRVKSLGWTKPNPQPRSARVFRFLVEGDPNESASWSLQETITTSPSDVEQFKSYRWFFDKGAGPQNLRPVPFVDHNAGAVFDGPSVTLRGTAADDGQVEKVHVKIKDRATGKWLRPNGDFGARPYYHKATIVPPQSASTTWSLTVNLPEGRFNPVVRATDDVGKRGSTTRFRPIEVTSGPDVEDPRPQADHDHNEVFAGPVVTISGSASDNRGVTEVSVKFKDRNSGKWLQPDGSFGNSPVYFDAELGTQGATATTWTITKTLPDGDYNPVVKALDQAGNAGYLPSSRPIRVR